MDLANINFEDIGTWPKALKIIILVLLFAIIVGLGIYLDTRPQMAKLKKVRDHEKILKKKFEKKQHQASNLKAYQKQLREIKKTFGTLLRQLPERTEVPGLLEDISNTGIASGLEVQLFKPRPEKEREFYAELPIKIKVVGNYHQLASFVSDVATLPRIVTLHDFTIKEAKKSSRESSAKKKSKSRAFRAGERLSMEITAKTYRYRE